MDTWKLAALLAVGVAADSYLEAYAQSQGSSNLPPPGVVYAEPGPTVSQQFPTIPNPNYYLPPPPQQPSMFPQSLKQYDPSSLIPIGLSIATILKVILKLLIFKMIVKFIAVICVLLFLPKLDKDEQMMMTTVKPPGEEEEAGKRVLKAITTKPKICAEDDWPCYVWKAFTSRRSLLTRKQKTNKKNNLSEAVKRRTKEN